MHHRCRPGLALMIWLRRKLTVGKKSRVTGGGGIAMSRRFSTSTLLTRPKPFPSEAHPFARAAASLAAGVSLAASLNRIEHQPSTLSGAGSSTAAVARLNQSSQALLKQRALSAKSAPGVYAEIEISAQPQGWTD